MTIDKVFKPQEVADILKINYSYALRLIKNQTIKSFKVGSLYRVRESDLLALFKKEAK